MASKVKHLFRDYRDKKGVGECGARNLPDREVTTKACYVTCTKCINTAAFKKAAKDPFYGVGQKIKSKRGRNEPTLEDIEEEMFR